MTVLYYLNSIDCITLYANRNTIKSKLNYIYILYYKCLMETTEKQEEEQKKYIKKTKNDLCRMYQNNKKK